MALIGRLEIETYPTEPRKSLQFYLISGEGERRKPELAWGGQLIENVPLKTMCRLNCECTFRPPSRAESGRAPPQWLCSQFSLEAPEPLCRPCWARAQRQLPTRMQRHSSEEPATLLLCCAPWEPASVSAYSSQSSNLSFSLEG